MQILSKSTASDFTGSPRIGAGLSFSKVTSTIEELKEVGDSVSLTVTGDVVYEVATVTLNKNTDDWKYTLENLPAKDESGKPYYYWAKEIEINGKAVEGYTVSYDFKDGTDRTLYSISGEDAGDGIITIRNTPDTTPPPEGADLPTSGGSGTAPYRTAGFLLMMTAVTFPYIKHRNRRKRNSA